MLYVERKYTLYDVYVCKLYCYCGVCVCKCRYMHVMARVRLENYLLELFLSFHSGIQGWNLSQSVEGATTFIPLAILPACVLYFCDILFNMMLHDNKHVLYPRASSSV